MSSGKPRNLVFDTSYIAVVHTAFASTAFVSALLLACLLHYKKVVRNGVAEWPEEWWPSVSATYVKYLRARSVDDLYQHITRVQNWGLVS